MNIYKISYCLFFLIFPAVLSFGQNSNSDIDNKLVKLFQNQEYNTAAILLKPLIQEDSTNIHYLSLIAYSFYMDKHYSPAEHYYSKILNYDSAYPQAYYYLGNINIYKGKNKDALTYFSKLVQLRPNIALYYKQLASLWKANGNSDSANHYYKIAYQTKPYDPEIIVSYANTKMTY